MIRQINSFIRILYSRIVNYPRFKMKKIVYGSGFTVLGRVHVDGPKGRITFGDNCTLRSSLYSNPLGGINHIIISIRNDGIINCGNNVGISNSCLRICDFLNIEDDVLIGGDCKIYDSDMHPIEYKDRILNNTTSVKCKGITIKRGAWIGAHSTILKGVTIGERSVVGANSVVTKDIPDDELWAGNPARFIKKINEDNR